MATANVTTVASGNPPFDRPSGLVFHPTASNILFVVNFSSNFIRQIDTNSNNVTNLNLSEGLLSGPVGITIDPLGNLYVANYRTSTVSKLVATGNPNEYSCTTLTFPGPNLLGSPAGITIDSLGNLYVANYRTSTVSKLVATGNPNEYSCTTLTFPGPNLLGSPAGITIDALGNLYVANFGDNNISKLVPTGNPNEYSCTTLSLTGDTLTGVRGLTFDSVGYLYVAGRISNSVFKIVLSGTNGVVSTYISSGLIGPLMITVNSSNYLYISNYLGDSVAATTSPLCFNHDTKILCLNKEFQEQYIPIQDLRKGDVVKTYLHGYREIQFIGKGACSNNPHVWYGSMYKMEKTDTNGLFEDLIVTGGHAILVDQVTEEQENAYEPLGVKGFSEKIDDKFLLLAAVSDQFVQLTDNEMYTYYHLVLENDGDDNQKFGIWANGILSESTTKQHYLMTGFEDL